VVDPFAFKFGYRSSMPDVAPVELRSPDRGGPATSTLVEPAFVDLSVVIPAFNEQRRIGHSMDAVCRYLDLTGRTWELIVVDDGSTDGTARMVRARAEHDPRVTLIRLGRHGGKGYAMRVGVLASRGTDVLITDADLSTPIAEVEKLRAAGGGTVAVVVASRAQPGRHIEVRQNRLRHILGRLGNRYIRAVAVPGIRDTQCGFKLLRGQAARALIAQTRLNGWGIDVELLHLCARFGWPVIEVGVRWRHCTGSKIRPIAYLRVLVEVAYVRVVHRHARATLTPD
jgi:dolichyl-phosphate beta-glucosyltransferase